MSSSIGMSAHSMPTPEAPLDERTVAALQQAVSVLAAKWSVVVLARLSGGTHRFNELTRQIDGVSRRMLSTTLRQLERDGLIERHVDAARVPARVSYELSTSGEALLSALTPLAGWGLDHADDLAAARVHFERLQSQRSESEELKARSQSTPRIV
jgi:DNA-binding HxlR family transcriptional regulator